MNDNEAMWNSYCELTRNVGVNMMRQGFVAFGPEHMLLAVQFELQRVKGEQTAGFDKIHEGIKNDGN